MKKIVIIGPESTGKSTLCEQLAGHFNTKWCPEYAREYLLKNGTDYSYADLLTIAKGQIRLEETYLAAIEKDEKQGYGSIAREKRQPAGQWAAPASQLLFIDTDMYVMKVWCEFVFNNCHRFILDEIVKRKYDLYLLCNVDLPWVKDELREYPDLENRLNLYYIYKDIMVNQSVPWIDISGGYEERLQKAIEGVNRQDW